jgi:hypothetical protein
MTFAGSGRLSALRKKADTVEQAVMLPSAPTISVNVEGLPKGLAKSLGTSSKDVRETGSGSWSLASLKLPPWRHCGMGLLAHRRGQSANTYVIEASI